MASEPTWCLCITLAHGKFLKVYCLFYYVLFYHPPVSGKDIKDKCLQDGVVETMNVKDINCWKLSRMGFILKMERDMKSSWKNLRFKFLVEEEEGTVARPKRKDLVSLKPR